MKRERQREGGEKHGRREEKTEGGRKHGQKEQASRERERMRKKEKGKDLDPFLHFEHAKESREGGRAADLDAHRGQRERHFVLRASQTHARA